MLFANEAPKATRMPIVTGPADGTIKAALEAMNRFEGPAKGIMLNPNEDSKTIMSSMIVAIHFQHLLNQKTKPNL